MTDSYHMGYQIEEAAFAAWPAAETVIRDGWVARFSAGYTGRANSVTPWGPVAPPYASQVDLLEQLYRERGLPPLFRLTSLDDYSELDACLAGRGYTQTSPTRVMTSDCHVTDHPDLSALSLDDWLACYDDFSPVVNSAAHKEILARINSPHMYAALIQGNEVVGVCLGARYGQLLGLFDLVVAEAHRGNGHGQSLVRGVLAWGYSDGATTAYLQVTERNHRARRLYHKLGFREAYSYHYRK